MAVFRECFKTLMKIVTSKHFLNQSAPVCFIVGLPGIAGWGVVHAIPYLYHAQPKWICSTIQSFGCFLALEIFLNWLCLVFVDSTYDTLKHGSYSLLVDINSLRLPDAQSENLYNYNTNTYKFRKDAYVHLPHQIALEATKNKQMNQNGDLQPYFIWTYCTKCNQLCPPRTHHCVLCNKCVLKRDHHCYVAATCIGYRNLRHFSVFAFWASIATIFAAIHCIPYTYYQVLPYVSYMDLLYPIAVVRALFGYIHLQFLCLIILGWMLLGYLFFSIITVIKVFSWITLGKTSFEVENNIDMCNTESLKGRLRAVYGHYWILNFLVPLHLLFEPIDDPVTWPYLKLKSNTYCLSKNI